MCPAEGQQSRFHVPHTHVYQFTRRRLQAGGRRPAGLALFPQTDPPLPVLQRDRADTAEEGEDKRLQTDNGSS